MLGVAHIPMPAILRSQSSQSSRISLTHAVRFAALAVMFAIPLAGQTGTPLTVTITDNASDSPQMVPLTGIGVGGKVRPK
jgi:hypothetical protein